VHHSNGCPQADGTNQDWKAAKITVADDDDDDYKSAEESKEKALCPASSTDKIEVTHSSTPGSRAIIVGEDERKSDLSPIPASPMPLLVVQPRSKAFANCQRTVSNLSVLSKRQAILDNNRTVVK
jgi:hypothetical protein